MERCGNQLSDVDAAVETSREPDDEILAMSHVLERVKDVSQCAPAWRLGVDSPDFNSTVVNEGLG